MAPGFKTIAGLLVVSGVAALAHAEEPALFATWAQGGESQEIKRWSAADIAAQKSTSASEKLPDGPVSRWKGVPLTGLIEEAIKALPAERKSQVDLVVLKSADGKHALIPRAFTVKYPVLLAFEKDGKPLPDGGRFQSVVPWTSRPRILRESVPVELYFVPGVRTIELTNYRERYSGVFLQRRTDPAAVRGEKLFVKNCISCHASGHGPSVQDVTNRTLASAGHPAAKGFPQLTEKDWRALASYIRAHRVENGGAPAESAQASR